MIMGYGKKKEWVKILKLFQREQNDYGLHNLATTLSQLAWKIPAFQPKPDLYEIYRATADCIDNAAAASTTIDPPLYADICRSIGKLQARYDDSAQRIINHLANGDFVQSFLERSKNPQDISNLAWSLARLSRPDLMEILLSVMIHSNKHKSLDPLLFTKTPEVPANMIWACAKLNLLKSPTTAEEKDQEAAVCVTTPLLQAIENRAVWMVFHGRPGEIDKTAWAFATLEYPSPTLFAAIEKRSDWFAVHGDPVHIGHTAWAFATLNYHSPAFFTAVETCADRLMQKGDPRNVANMAWAFATLNYPSPTMFAAIEKHANWLVTNGTPQDIATIAWAFSQLGHSAPYLLRSIARLWDVLKAKGDHRAIESLEETFQKLDHPIPQ